MTARIPPVSAAERDDEIERALGPLSTQDPLENVFATFVRHPDLYRRFAKLAGHVLFASTLDPRRRELAILRIGWRNGCRYEFAAHYRMARDAGLSDEDITRVCRDDAADGWNSGDALVLRTVDELVATRTIGDETWALLAGSLGRHQLMDLVFTIGTYNLVSWSLNAFQVEIDAHFPPLLWPSD